MSGSTSSARRWLIQLLIGFAVATVPAFAQLKWEKAAPFPEPREEILGIAVRGKLYVFAGLIPLWKPAGMVYEYDPASNKWTKRDPMPLPSHHVALAEYRGDIYMFGGFVYPRSAPPAWDPIDNAWKYDPTTDRWKALAPMPEKRGAAVAAAVGDKIYVIGGASMPPGSQEKGITPMSPQVCLGTVDEYDPASNTWRQRAPMPTPRNHAAVGVVNGKIYVIGGRVGAAFIGVASDVSVVEEYDPATNTWGAPRARMPTTRSALTAGVYDGRIYIAGGEYQDPRMMATFRAFEAYDPATNTWETLPSLPVARHGLAGGMIGSHFHVVGGDVQSSGSGIDASTGEHDVIDLAAAYK